MLNPEDYVELLNTLEVTLDISDEVLQFTDGARRITIKVSLLLDGEVISSAQDYFNVKEN